MKRHLLLLFLFAASVLSPLSAQQRTESEALAIAKAFMEDNGYSFNVTKKAKTRSVTTSSSTKITPYYIFNDTEKGGFVVVGGCEGISDILAYSTEGCMDVDNLPPAAKAWLDSYAVWAKNVTENPSKAVKNKKLANDRFASRKIVQPLLGEINYNQHEPYNDMCPTFKRNMNGSITTDKTVTGCTATSMAMIMRYWRYPQHSKGYKSYKISYTYSSGTSKELTLTVDYDANGSYDWDKILPTYRSGTSYNTDEAKEIAKLMFHCGVALSANYGVADGGMFSGTGAGTNPDAMVQYFGYSPDHRKGDSQNYSDDLDTYLDILSNELSQGRPIWISGNSHAYVCDGHDLNGLFHLNLGWDGYCNGYYDLTPSSTSEYGYPISFYYNIHPEGIYMPQSPTRRVVMEAGLGDWNETSAKIISAWKGLDKEDKFGQTLICIATADSTGDAEAYLPGLSGIKGVYVNRCDTVTSSAMSMALNKAYDKHSNEKITAHIDADAVYTSDSTLQAKAFVSFSTAETDADYKILFVYTENGVTINSKSYNYIARGSYPAEESLPATIDKEQQYTIAQQIPLPATIDNRKNCRLIALLIDGKSGSIVNANSLQLSELDNWTGKATPTFYSNGKTMLSSVVSAGGYDSNTSCVPYNIQISNELGTDKEITLELRNIEFAEGSKLALGNEFAENKATMTIPACSIDSSIVVNMHVENKSKDLQSSLLVVMKHEDKEVAYLKINFFYYNKLEGVNAYTIQEAGTLKDLIPKEVLDTMTVLTLGGRFNSRDVIFIRENLMHLRSIDMRKCDIVASEELYYQEYKTTDNIVGRYMFHDMKELETFYTPETVIRIDNYAFKNCTKLNKVIFNDNLGSIYFDTFNGCTALHTLNLPAKVNFFGSGAFSKVPLRLVICNNPSPGSCAGEAFDTTEIPFATLVVPDEASVKKYSEAWNWKSFGKIITHEQYLTGVDETEADEYVTVKDGTIIVNSDKEVIIYSLSGAKAAEGTTKEYILPAGTYIVKIGNNAVRVKL